MGALNLHIGVSTCRDLLYSPNDRDLLYSPKADIQQRCLCLPAMVLLHKSVAKNLPFTENKFATDYVHYTLHWTQMVEQPGRRHTLYSFPIECVCVGEHFWHSIPLTNNNSGVMSTPPIGAVRKYRSWLPAFWKGCNCLVYDIIVIDSIVKHVELEYTS